MCFFVSNSKRTKSTFGVPKDLKLCKTWEESLGITLKSTSRICEVHFDTQDITNEWVSSQGSSIYVVSLLLY